MSTKLSPDKWACGCPKPISCQNKNLIQLTLTIPIPVIPILGSSITSSGGAIVKLYGLNYRMVFLLQRNR